MSQLTVLVDTIDIYPFILNFASKHTQKAYMTDLKGFFDFLGSHGVQASHPRDLSLIHFIAYRDFMVKEGMSPKTVARKISAIKSLMDWFLDNKHITNNPATSLKVGRADAQAPTQALTDEEVVKLLNSTKAGSEHQLMLIFMFMFALRKCELLGIKMSDIYYVGDHLVLKITGKGGKTRELPFNQHAKAALEKFVSLNPPKAEDEILFQYNSASIHKIFKRYSSRVGITKRVSPHSARATAITKALESGAIITDVADMAGHADIKTTQIYWKRRRGLESSPIHKIVY